jgi:hypothetical protein
MRERHTIECDRLDCSLPSHIEKLGLAASKSGLLIVPLFNDCNATGALVRGLLSFSMREKVV